MAGWDFKVKVEVEGQHPPMSSIHNQALSACLKLAEYINTVNGYGSALDVQFLDESAKVLLEELDSAKEYVRVIRTL